MNLTDRIRRAARSTVGSAAQIKQLARKNGARVHYVLQPLSRWSKEIFHESEEEMFYAIDACANNFWRLFEKLAAPDLHESYSSQLEQGCMKEGIKYFDMNRLMKDSPVLNQNIYIDHLHFNDAGYEEMGRIIYEKVI
ncbi:hypothetical protein ABK905_01985 [Acerihabitans sp. KWT182]|uniref:SGNH/GDSL hydrolase family protein n=1 Tax=Acerihabitans sp. KWT182 TaxID=3157919 RepID=A0AAU7QAI8_9GAMM